MTMMNSPGSNRELEFQNRLLATVSEVGRHTRIGLTAIRQDIESVGGLQAAKTRLRGIWLHNHSIRPSEYFLTTRRVGRMDLSIEAILLSPVGWVSSRGKRSIRLWLR